MKNFICLLTIALCISCNAHNPVEKNNKLFQELLSKHQLGGAILLFDVQQNEFHSNDFETANSPSLPASTFKIPNTLIGLETGVIKEDHIFKWNGEERRLPVWNKDMNIREAFQSSCVPCYRELARNIGLSQMQEYVKKFEFGNMMVNANNLDLFWLTGNSSITPMQQVTFLNKLYSGDLPISKENLSTFRKISLVEESVDFTIFGKSGWVTRDGFNLGWYVAFVESKRGNYILALRVEPTEKFDLKRFPSIRKQLAFEVLQEFGVI